MSVVDTDLDSLINSVRSGLSSAPTQPADDLDSVINDVRASLPSIVSGGREGDAFNFNSRQPRTILAPRVTMDLSGNATIDPTYRDVQRAKESRFNQTLGDVRAGKQAGFLGRVGSAAVEGVAGAAEGVGNTVDQMMRASGTDVPPIRDAAGNLARGAMQSVGAMEPGANAEYKRIAAQASGPEQALAGLYAMPVQMLDPKAVAALLVMKAPVFPGAATVTEGVMAGLEPSLASLEGRFGPKFAGLVRKQIQAGTGLGGFSGVQSTLSGNDPEQIAKDAAGGALMGAALEAPMGLAGLASKARAPGEVSAGTKFSAEPAITAADARPTEAPQMPPERPVEAALPKATKVPPEPATPPTEAPREPLDDLIDQLRPKVEKPPQEPTNGLPPAEETSLPVRQGIPDERAGGVQEAVREEAPAQDRPPADGQAPDVLSEEPVSTSARKAQMTEDRAALGLDELDGPDRRSWQTALDDAKAKGLPEQASQLAAELNDKPRALNDTETAGLVVRAADLKNQHAKLSDQIGKATDPTDVADLSAQVGRIEQDFDSLSRALRSSGTEKGRALASQKLTIDQNFDLLAVKTRAKAAKGSALSPAESQHLETLTKKLEATTARVAELEKTVSEQAKPRTRPVVNKALATLHKAADGARERIKARGIRLRSGIDPVELADYAIIGADHIATGAVKLADWSAKMVAEFGEGIRPHLDQIFKASEKKHASITGSVDPSTRARLEAKIAELEGHLQAGTLPDKAPPKPAPPAEIGELRDTVKEKRRELNQSDPAVRARLEKTIGRLKQKLADEPVGAKAKAEPNSPELRRLSYERDRLRQQINQRIRDLKPKSFWTKVAEPLNAARSVMTGLDLSAVLRQGGFIAYGNPVRALRAFPDMLRAFASERKSYEVNKEILTRPNAPLYARSKLYLAPEGTSSLGQMEEAFMSRLAAKIPGIAGSQRAYNTFLNKLRADSFDAMSETLARNGEPTLEESKAIANYINVATGRGKLGPAEQAAVPLGTVFFSPRYLASRFQLIAGEPMHGGTMRTRKMIAGEYAKFFAGLGTVYGLGQLGGGTIEQDPRSSDFGKIKLGNSRLDPLMGISQIVTLGSRLGTGETKKLASGKIVPIRGDKVPFGGDTAADVVTRFLRTKLSPVVGGAIDLAAGKNVVGEKVGPVDVAKTLVTPMSFRDIYESMREHGVPEGMAIGLLAVFGMGVQNYNENEKKTKKVP